MDELLAENLNVRKHYFVKEKVLYRNISVSAATSAEEVDRLKAELGIEHECEYKEDRREISKQRKALKRKLSKLLKQSAQFEKAVIVLPQSMVTQVISHFHDSSHYAHLGVAKTLDKIKRRFFFKGMAHQVREYIRSCPTCQKFKYPNKKPSGLMGIESEATNVFEQVYVDVIGPLPSYKNLKHVIICVDKLSAWVELKAISNITASKIATFLDDDVFCRFGYSKRIITDNASYFTCPEFRRFCKKYGITHRFTANYHQQSNRAEREVRNIKPMLAAALETEKNWPEILQKFALALRSSARESHWFSPAHINLGRTLNLPIDSYLASSNVQSDEEDVEKIASSLPGEVAKVVEFVREKLQQAKEVNKLHYDEKHIPCSFKVGQKVLLRNRPRSSKKKKESAKLMAKWRGPYEIKSIIDENELTFELLDCNTRKPLKYSHHIGDIKPFVGRDDSNHSNGSAERQKEVMSIKDKLQQAISKSELRGIRRSIRIKQMSQGVL